VSSSSAGQSSVSLTLPIQNFNAAQDRRSNDPEPGVAEVMVKNAGGITGSANFLERVLVALWIVPSGRPFSDPIADMM
jgi:hypothetical protein